MCGIAGWIAGPDSALMEDTLSSMLQAIAHRGPDDEGKCYFRGAGTGQRVFLARDRFGEKPLFVYENGTGLYFASEIKALLRVPGISAGVNLGAVWDYLAYRYVPGPQTLFAGIRKLMPGTAATWERGKLKEERYWTAPDCIPCRLQQPH